MESGFRILEFFHVREKATGFKREAKFVRRDIVPISKGGCGRQAIKAVVDLYSFKILDVKTKHVGCSNVGRIEGSAPMLVVPS